MKYAERRRRVFALMAEAGELIRDSGRDRNRLWAAANDDLSDAVAAGAPKGLREAFTDVTREFWLREHGYSVRVPERPVLTVVKGGS